MSEIISTDPFSQLVDGFQVPGTFPPDLFRSAVNYKARPDDLFLVTYPKCGTTWVGNILVLILQHGQPLKSSSEMHSKGPFLEMMGPQSVENMVRPAPIKTHLPFHLTPWSNEAKYIYVTRNPKDCCVSYFHQMKNIPGHNFTGNFDRFFELFITGKIDYGDYFDHLLSWYPHRNDPNVLFVTYEELQEDIDTAILKMASFIDDEKYAEPIRNNPEVMENIKKYSSFKEMKDFMSKGFEQKSAVPDTMKEFFRQMQRNPQPDAKTGPPNMSQFIRKGVVGDWKNYFTEDQSRRLDQKFAEKTKDTDIAEYWKRYM